jgi:hypothetical protein
MKISAQELVQVTDETITVNSTTAMTGYTRNKTEVTLPEKTKAYIYRISIFPKGKSAVDNSLFELLKQMGTANISIATSFAQLAIKNNDNFSVDAFIFNNTYDADNFYDKKDNNWSSCKSMTNRVSCCFSTKECIGREIYFGFRNNNIMQGLDVKLEIVAIVDSTLKSDYKYSYTIDNGSNKVLKYFISLDNNNWEETSLRSSYQQVYTFEQREIYFKIKTDNFKFSTYKLTPNERYKIFWNEKLQKWDLTRY